MRSLFAAVAFPPDVKAELTTTAFATARNDGTVELLGVRLRAEVVEALGVRLMVVTVIVLPPA